MARSMQCLNERYSVGFCCCHHPPTFLGYCRRQGITKYEVNLLLLLNPITPMLPNEIIPRSALIPTKVEKRMLVRCNPNPFERTSFITSLASGDRMTFHCFCCRVYISEPITTKGGSSSWRRRVLVAARETDVFKVCAFALWLARSSFSETQQPCTC